jgi:putative ABC transport system substrate-binding protein
MRRREFIALAGGAAAWPMVTRAQQVMPTVGFLRSTTLADSTHLVEPFRLGLKEAGFVEGQNVAIEQHYADNKVDRLPAMVADVLRRPVTMIVGDNLAATSAKVATATVPIVFAMGGDPVKQGLVAIINRPGGNVTGVVFFTGELGAKRLALLRQLVSKAATIAALMNPVNDTTKAERADVQTAAQAIGQQIVIVDVNSTSSIDAAFATFAQSGAGALLVGSGAFMNSNREQIAHLAARYRLPTISAQGEVALAGGLMSYGPNIPDAYRQAGTYAGRILGGEKPADLPVMRSSKFEFVINLKTAKLLGLEIPATVLALADQVIE